MHTSYVPSSAPLVGRTIERDAALAAFRRAVAGEAQVLLITGEAGIGKTRLVTELCAVADGARVLIGGCVPMVGETLVYGPWVAALPGEAGWLLGEDGPADPLAARHRLFQRVLMLLTRMSARAPLVLVLEDMHWADESSRMLLAFLAVRLRGQPVLVVATLRAEELDGGALTWLAELQRNPRATVLRLAVLDDSAIAALVAGLMPGGTEAGQVTAVVRAAAGNPFYAEELARAAPHWPPPSLAEAIRAGLATARPAVRDVIVQACVSDDGVSHELLATAVPLAEDDLLAALREATATRLLAPTADGYVIPHELTRQVLYGDLLPGERRLLHRRLAAALAAGGAADPARVARHWQLADRPGEAAAAALDAARRAMSARAYPEASRLFDLVAGLATWLPEWGPGIAGEAARAASLAGHPDRAVAHATEAVGLSGDAPAERRARLLERLGRYRWESGDPRGAAVAAADALGLIGDLAPTALHGRLLAARATWLMMLGQRDDALPLAEQAVRLSAQAGADAERSHGLAALGVLRAQRGDLDGGLAELREAFALARDCGSAEDMLRAANSHMYLLCTAGRFAEALQVAGEGRQAARALGVPPTLTAVLDNNTAAVLVATGRWAQAGELLAELVGESVSHVTRYLDLLRLELAVGQGDHQQATALAGALADATDGPRLTGPLHACLAERALLAGDLPAAAEHVLAGLVVLGGGTLAEEEMRLLAAGAWLVADLAVLPTSVRPPGLPVEWDATAAGLRDRAAAITVEEPVVTAFGALVAAELARGDAADTRATWRAVARLWQAAGQPYREAYARLREAQAAARGGRRDQAARALAACTALAGDLPSAPLLQLAEAMARRARVPSQSSGPVRARLDLTDREAQVLALLKDGQSNRQIARSLCISERTVAVHLSRIFGKLGVRNRTEAAIAAARLDRPEHVSAPGSRDPADATP
jgi:DNA-binding CsgD family transcriptional regulator